jgi:hypothetical protein
LVSKSFQNCFFYGSRRVTLKTNAPLWHEIVLLQRSVTIVLFLAFSLSQLKGQSFDERNFSLYSVKDGLSNNQVGTVTQDAYGYIWIGTNKGLNRFDGNSFLQFYSGSKSNGLPQIGCIN